MYIYLRNFFMKLSIFTACFVMTLSVSSVRSSPVRDIVPFEDLVQSVKTLRRLADVSPTLLRAVQSSVALLEDSEPREFFMAPPEIVDKYLNALKTFLFIRCFMNFEHVLQTLPDYQKKYAPENYARYHARCHSFFEGGLLNYEDVWPTHRPRSSILREGEKYMGEVQPFPCLMAKFDPPYDVLAIGEGRLTSYGRPNPLVTPRTFTIDADPTVNPHLQAFVGVIEDQSALSYFPAAFAGALRADFFPKEFLLSLEGLESLFRLLMPGAPIDFKSNIQNASDYLELDDSYYRTVRKTLAVYMKITKLEVTLFRERYAFIHLTGQKKHAVAFQVYRTALLNLKQVW